MHTRKSGLALAVAASVALMVACGGGGGGGTTAGGGGSIDTGGGGGGGGTPSTTAVAVTVIDGAIRNATVCLDKNLNGACDTGEPSATTDAAGAATLQVDAADAGKYPVLAVVGTDAVDADNGPVTTAFVLKAPADQTAVISPLTTLVQSQVEATGASTATAEAAVKAQIGLDVSLFQDFTKSTTAEGATLNAIARTVVVTTQKQNEALAASVGTAAIDGSTITQQDLNDLITRKLLEVLPALVAQLADPAVQAAIASKDPAQLTAALAPVVTSAVTSSGITSTSVGTLVGIANQQQSATAEAPATPVASAVINQLTYTGPGNWFQRVFTSTAAQNTPDAGHTRAVERRSRANSGAVAHWAFGGNPNSQSDFHWNGGSWVQCALQAEVTSTVRDAEGRSTSDYCDKFDVSSSVRAVFDVSGKTMIEVYNQARNAGFTNLTIANAASMLGTATFPAESKLFYQTNTPLSTAIAYGPSPGNEMLNTAAPIAAGNTSASDTTAACATIMPNTPQSSYTTPATTLESFIAANTATPCHFGPNQTMQVPSTSGTPATVSSGPRNEWWNNSTANMGQLGSAQVGATQQAGSESYYTTNTLLRVGFGPGNVAKYFACQQRATDGSTRNCDPIGTGTYSIVTLGDARVLTLANTPVQAAVLQERVFVERGGKVRVGYKNRTTPNSTARLNLPAANALLTKLGMETINPDAAFNLTPASYQGDWMVWNAADVGAAEYSIIRISQTYNGSTTGYLCFDYTGEVYDCALTLDPATGAVTMQDSDDTFTGTFGMASGAVTGTFQPLSGPVETIVGRRR